MLIFIFFEQILFSAENTTQKSNEKAIKLLTTGLLNLYEPQLDVVHKNLKELM